MAPHNDVRALEYTRFHHDGLGFRRHHLFSGTAVNGDRAGSVRAREELRDGDGGCHPHWTLGAVLVTMERALGAAQRVVFENDAEIGAGYSAFVFGNESGGQTSHR